ncbi:MAG: S8 family peptidase [Lachnospiraceae bacterium]|nr:S8 family serine peptidase [Lachnospiraceae bacterium]MDY3221827.1 S8 family peptidase [Lachnospiraceae bacterium]
MANSQKQENLLNLALDSTEEERVQSEILNVGFDESTRRWEVIVKYHGDLERIANEEIDVEILLAGYAIVTLPEKYMEALADMEETEYIEKPKSLTYGLFEAKENSCIYPSLQQEKNLTGQGVLMAIIDSGIDYLLPDFQFNGESRILYLWDQSQPPDETKGQHTPAGFRVGTEFNKAQIDAAIQAATKTGNRREALQIVPQQDTSGHGTGVAAVAASSNSSILLKGVASGCELLIVKLGTTPENDFPGTTQLMRGITYALRKALELNRPLVINLSYGNSYGSHDGTSLLERFLDNASGVGRNVICVGCGNEGAGGGHIEGNVKVDDMVELAVAERELTLNIQLWKSYEDRFGVILVSPGRVRYEVVLSGSPGRQEVVLGTTKVLIYVGMPTPYSSLQELFFVFLPTGAYVDSGVWEWQFTPEKIVSGNYQMYLPTAALRNSGTRFFQPTPNLTLTIPSTARAVISVAAYNDTLNAYADFSGRGLPESGQIYLDSEGGKPDLAAPGVGILAAKAGGGTDTYTGTSFAAPMVSGAAALLMEWGIVQGNDPYLYGEKVKAFLRKGAKPIRGEGSYPNNRVGDNGIIVSSWQKSSKIKGFR